MRSGDEVGFLHQPEAVEQMLRYMTRIADLPDRDENLRGYLVAGRRIKPYRLQRGLAGVGPVLKFALVLGLTCLLLVIDSPQNFVKLLSVTGTSFLS